MKKRQQKKSWRKLRRYWRNERTSDLTWRERDYWDRVFMLALRGVDQSKLWE